MPSLNSAPPVRLLFVSLILTVVRATSPAWASGPTSDFRAEIIRTAEGHAEVKWPTRKGGYYTLQYSISLEEIGWTDLFTAYAGSTSSPGNLATYTGVRVYNAPAPGTPPPASNVVNYAFSLRRDGAKTLAVWQSLEGNSPTTFAYLNQDWGTGTFANLPPISTYNCPGGISVTLVVADPLPLPSPLPAAVSSAAEATFLSIQERTRLAILMDNRSTILNTLASGILPATVPPAGTPPPIINEGGQTIYTTGIPGGQNGIVVNNGASTTPVGPRQFFRIRESGVDSDGDGLLDWDEYTLGLNAFAVDSNGDGVADSAADSDQDGVSNADEIARGTDPNNILSFPPVWRTIKRDCGYVFYTHELPPNGTFTYGGDWAANLNAGSPEDISTTLSLTTGMVNRLASKVPFPEVSALAPSPISGHTSFSLDVATEAWIYNDTGQGPDGDVEHARIWISRSPAAPTAVVRKAIKVTTTFANSQVQTTSVTPVTFTVPANGSVSNVYDLNTNHPNPSDSFTFYTTLEGLAELEAAPEVLRVNTDFDEGRLDPITGFALDDASDEDLKADRNRPDGRIKAGEVVTEDLCSGWFGLNPNALSPSFYDGATVHIRKLNLTDSETGRPESGHVRFWVTQGSGTDGHAWPVKSYDFNTLQPVNLVGLVYGSNPTIPDGVDKKYWIEGVKPGRITLEFRFAKGSISFTHVQTFLVSTQQTKQKWLAEIRDQIRLQSNGQIDLDRYLPESGWLPRQVPGSGGIHTRSFLSHTDNVRAIYDYYGQLFQEWPEKLDWMGAARMVGAAVYAGLSDLHSQWPTFSVGPELMGGQILIYRDLAWQHRAYVASGISALEWVDQNDSSSINGLAGQHALEIQAWRDYHVAILNNSVPGIRTASQRLVRREQEEVIEPMWSRIQSIAIGFLEVASGEAKNPADINSPKFRDVVPGGNVVNYPDREKFSFGWGGSPQGSKGVFPVWWGTVASSGTPVANYDPTTRLNLVKIPLKTRAEAFAKSLPLK